MMLMMIISSVLLILSLVIMMLTTTLSKKSFMDREKNSPFECGFDPKSNARLPFSMKFFLIAVIFLIFDVEIALLLPTIIITYSSHMYSLYITLTIFILILIIGLYHEWNQGALEWAL